MAVATAIHAVFVALGAPGNLLLLLLLTLQTVLSFVFRQVAKFYEFVDFSFIKTANMATAAVPNSDLLCKISKNCIFNARTNEKDIPVGGLWADGPVVIMFLRRFGWQLCRLGAVKISIIEPLLSKHGIKVVAVGLEMLGVEEFIERKFFPDNVDIYVDEKKICYQCLGFKRFTLLNVFKALISSVSRKAIMEARRSKIEGNMQGDGLQNGGLIIVGKDSKLLLFHKEEYPGEHVENDVILKTLEVDEKTVVSAEKADTMAKMEEEGLNCDKTCFGDDQQTAAAAKKKMFVAKKKT